MAFSHSTSGASNQGSIVRGNVALISGQFNATDGTAYTITTGVSGRILACGVESTSSATVMPLLHRNLDSGDNASSGQIKIQTTGTGNAGYWWAIAQLTGSS